MEALELDKPVSPKPSIRSTDGKKKGPNAPDFTVLQKHMLRTLKYPASARENTITGFVVVNFSVKDKKIERVNIVKGLQNDINDDATKTLHSFQTELDVTNGNYSVAIRYLLSGIAPDESFTPLPGGSEFHWTDHCFSTRRWCKS